MLGKVEEMVTHTQIYTYDPATQMDSARQSLSAWANDCAVSERMGDTHWAKRSAEMVDKYTAILADLKLKHGNLGNLSHIDEHFDL